MTSETCTQSNNYRDSSDNLFSTIDFKYHLNLYIFYLNVSKKNKRQFNIGIEHIHIAYDNIKNIKMCIVDELEDILTEYEDMYNIYICLIYYIFIYSNKHAEVFKNEYHTFSTKYKNILHTFGLSLLKRK